MKSMLLFGLALLTFAATLCSQSFLPKQKLRRPTWVEPIGTQVSTDHLLSLLAKPLPPHTPPERISDLFRLLQEFVPIVVDASTLADEGIGWDYVQKKSCVEVMSSSRLSAANLLELHLARHRIDWTIRDSQIVLTIFEDHKYPRTRFYPCPRMEYQDLLTALEDVPGNWDTLGGTDTMRLVDVGNETICIVTTSMNVHLKIESLLNELGALYGWGKATGYRGMPMASKGTTWLPMSGCFGF